MTWLKKNLVTASLFNGVSFSCVIFIANEFEECVLESAALHVRLNLCENFEVSTHMCQVSTCVACVLFVMYATGLYGLFINVPNRAILQKNFTLDVIDKRNNCVLLNWLPLLVRKTFRFIWGFGKHDSFYFWGLELWFVFFLALKVRRNTLQWFYCTRQEWLLVLACRCSSYWALMVTYVAMHIPVLSLFVNLHFSAAILLHSAVESSVMVIVMLKMRLRCKVSAAYLGNKFMYVNA